MKILIAGIGNVLRGDDAFGIEVVHALVTRNRLPDGVDIFEAGIAGIPLVQELMSGYDALIMIDATDRKGAPGTIYVLEPQLNEVSIDPYQLHLAMADAHYTDPSKIFMLAKALGVLPRSVFVVGCQPAGFDELGAELSEAVKTAVPHAVSRIESLVENLHSREIV